MGELFTNYGSYAKESRPNKSGECLLIATQQHKNPGDMLNEAHVSDMPSIEQPVSKPLPDNHLDTSFSLDGFWDPVDSCNTPVSYSERTSHASEPLLCDDMDEEAICDNSTPKTDKNPPYIWSKEGSRQSDNGSLVRSSENMRKQPSFQPAYGFDTPSPSEKANVHHLNISSNGPNTKRLLKKTQVHSFQPASPPRIRFIGPHAVGQRLEYILTDRQVTWAHSDTARQHRSQRPAPNSRKVYKLPIDDSDRPFPAPIPTINKLPLRRDSQSLKSNGANVRSQGLTETLPSETKQNLYSTKSEDSTQHSFWKPSGWKWLMEFVIISFSLHQPHDSVQSSSLNSRSFVLHVQIRRPMAPKNPSHMLKSSKETPEAVLEDPTRSVPGILRVHIFMPLAILRILGFMNNVIWRSAFSVFLSIVSSLISLALALVMILVVWVLKGLRVIPSVNKEMNLEVHTKDNSD